MAVLKRYVADLEAHIDSKKRPPPARAAGGLGGLGGIGTPRLGGGGMGFGGIALSDLNKAAAATTVAPPDKEKTEAMIVALKELSCILVAVPYSSGLDVIKIDDVPKKRLQSLLRSQMCIEYLIKLVKLCWEGFFDKQADLIKEMRDDKGMWSGKFAQVNYMCQLCHNLLKLTVANNSRSADTLQSIDAVEDLLDQLPSGWSPPVIEVFDALMRRRGEGGIQARGPV
eukprot:640325-Prymnesium_polylepis.1